MCANSRNWGCWNSIGFNGSLAVTRIVAAITQELQQLDEFDDEFAKLVIAAHQRRSCGPAERWTRLRREEETLGRERDNLMSAILQFGPRSMLEEKLKELESRRDELQCERHYLESIQTRELNLPTSVMELRQRFEQEFAALVLDSPELGVLLQRLVPSFHVYAVRLIDGGHLLPRARVTLNLGAHVDDAEYLPELNSLLTRVITIDLFDCAPQRERIREEVVRLSGCGITQREIMRQLSHESPKQPVVQKALALERRIREQGMQSPYVVVTEPPNDYPKLRRHLNGKYEFVPLEGYEPPQL
jgi:hypothetical protein